MIRKNETETSKPGNFGRPAYGEYNRYSVDDNQPELLLVTGSSGETETSPVKYFDLVSEEAASYVSGRPAGEVAGGNLRQGMFEGRRPNAANCARASQAFLSSAYQFPAGGAGDAVKLFDVLLVHLDQLIYMDEMREHLENLDAAIAAGNTAQIKSAADDCAGISAACGMFAALDPLDHLGRIESTGRLAGAAALSAQVRKEFEGFRLDLKENLDRLAPGKPRRRAN